MSAHPPDIVIVGHVTRDLIGDATRLGGAVSFAARAAAALGVRAAAVTAAPRDYDLMQPLRDEPGLELVVTDTEVPTTFELDYSGPVRRARLIERAPSLTAEHVPERLRAAPIAFVAPVAGECGADLVRAFSSSRVMVGLQGWLRGFADDGEVLPALSSEAESPPPGLHAVVFSELDHPDADAIAARFATAGTVVALTRGARGATLYADSQVREVAAFRAAEVDPTGAGDVFGLVLAVGMHRGLDASASARLAALAAARVVEGPGMGNLPAFTASRTWQELVAA